MGEQPKIKEQVKQLLDKLPDDCTYEDIQYHLYALQKIEAGLQSLKEHGGVPHEEAKRRLAKWLGE